jgi:dTDP-4-amino-4,6-dideoxygalactose transaminase
MSRDVTLPLEDQIAAVLGQMPDPSGGPVAAELERELAEAFGVPHVFAVASGTAALHAALPPAVSVRATTSSFRR